MGNVSPGARQGTTATKDRSIQLNLATMFADIKDMGFSGDERHRDLEPERYEALGKPGTG